MSANQAHFSRVPTNNAQRSQFKRPNNHKTTFDANYLIPIYVDEVIPGDTFKMSSTTFARLATPVKPSMDNAYLDIHYFFVPYRLLWDNWERFMGSRDNPTDSIDYLIPTRQMSWPSPEDHVNTIYDYFGLPYVPSGNVLEVSDLPFRAYNLIWNEWYRDQNLQDSVQVETGDVAGDPYTLLKRGKRHDYFTSCLPFPQKGEPVSLTLAGNAPVGTDAGFEGLISVLNSIDEPRLLSTDGAHAAMDIEGPAENGLYAKMDDITAVTINQLRQAFQLQRFLERDARSGTRYIEVIKSHFGVTNPDFRLQRPEYLGGSHENLNFTTIAQTSQEFTDTTPQGNLAAMATVTGRNKAFSKSFTEHGVILGLCSVYADQTYQQGVERMWFRQTRYDFYWPTFAHLGEQVVYNKEIFVSGDVEQDNGVFGYQERYAEYRYKPNRISGVFRSTAPQSLDVWHYAEEFENLPVLNSEFIECNSPFKRNSAVQTEPDFVADFHFENYSDRIMPMYGVPGYVDHF